MRSGWRTWVHASQQLLLARKRTAPRRTGLHAEVLVRALRRHAAARRAVEVALLDQERLVDVLDRAAILADRGGERVQPDGSPAVFLDERTQERAVHAVEAGLVDLETREREAGELARHRRLAADLGEVAHAAQQAVGDARRAPRAGRDLERALSRERDAEDARASREDLHQVARRVVLEPGDHA